MIKIFKSKFFLFTVVFSALLFYSIMISKNKGVIVIENKKNTESNISSSSTKFLNVEYKFTDTSGKKFFLKGKEATLSKENYNIIFLTSVTATTKLKDNSFMNISSDKADFFKIKKDIFFYNNIILINKDIVIKANNAKFLYKKNILEVFGNVIYKDKKNIIKCDKVLYDITNKNLELKMIKEKEQIYGRRK